MRIDVKVVLRAKKEKVEKQLDGSYKVWVRAVPEDGKANERVVALLAGFFKVSKRSVEIISGHTSRNKRVAINK